MTVTDWVLAGFLLFSLWQGGRLGIIALLAKIVSPVVSYLLARQWSSLLAVQILRCLPNLPQPDLDEPARMLLKLFVDLEQVGNAIVGILAFLLIFVLANWLLRKISYAVTDFFGDGFLQRFNRALGAAVSLLLSVLVILACANYVLPTCYNMGFGDAVLAWFYDSQVILPFLQGGIV